MPRVKRTQLPKVTPELLARYPEHIRSTPNGGRAWICRAKGCKQYASLAVIPGVFFCRPHAEPWLRAQAAKQAEASEGVAPAQDASPIEPPAHRASRWGWLRRELQDLRVQATVAGRSLARVFQRNTAS